MPDANLNQLWARVCVEELVRGGVEHAVVCPGSRSAPLALACAAQLKSWSVIDERGAAYFALGIAKRTGSPAVLVATSGTAGANFYPAVIEAASSHIPLVVLTADRPTELQGWGAPQTMLQQNLFGGFARWFVDLGIPEASAASLHHLRATAARAVATARRSPRGPVHLNVPFREPLAPTPDGLKVEALPSTARQGRAATPFTRLLSPSRGPDANALAELAAKMRQMSRGVIICGPNDMDDGLADRIIELGRARGYPVFAEATSQVRYGKQADVVTLYDALLRHPAFAKAREPELILRFGGGITTKVLQQWVDQSNAYVVQVSEDGALYDPGHVVNAVIEGDPRVVCARMATGKDRATNTWAAGFRAAEAQGRAALEKAFAASDQLTEPLIAAEVVAALPAHSNLFVSSSMPIRDVDTFATRGAVSHVLANRGVNGIDGIVSSALGVAAGSGKPTVLLTGDLAFLHDVGGLLTAKRHRLSLTVVVVQNDGGGIFSFLPMGQFPEHFETFFGTPHGVDLSHAAALFGASYAAPTKVSELRSDVANGLRGGLHVIEARVDRAQNPREHQALFEQIHAALGDGPWA